MSVGAALKHILPAGLVSHLRRGRDTLTAYRDRWLVADPATLEDALRCVGIRAGGVVFVQMSFDQMHAFAVSAHEVIDMLMGLVGPRGTVVMPTFPMRGLSQEYLDTNPSFDWRRTPSTSGLVSEVFRRMPGTERSLHPTHPVAARGPDAAWLTEGHELCATPFGAASPFARMLSRDAQILTIGRFSAMTFRHLADDLMQDAIAYPIYADRVSTVAVIARDGSRRSVTTVGHNPWIACDPRIVIHELIRQGRARVVKAARLPVLCVSSRDYIDAYRDAHARGLFRHAPRATTVP